jgi:hypothetical protein
MPNGDTGIAIARSCPDIGSTLVAASIEVPAWGLRHECLAGTHLADEIDPNHSAVRFDANTHHAFHVLIVVLPPGCFLCWGHLLHVGVTDNTVRPPPPRDTRVGPREVFMWKTAQLTLALAGMALASTSLAADNTAPDVAAPQAGDVARSVQALYAQCTATSLYEQSYCAGFFTASLDTMIVLGTDVSAQAFGICPKTTVTVGAAVQAFKNWAQKHPEAWSLQRYLGVTWALQEVWPCK